MVKDLDSFAEGMSRKVRFPGYASPETAPRACSFYDGSGYAFHNTPIEEDVIPRFQAAVVCYLLSFKHDHD